jgi:uncharacterized hydantoinase/oxoprolinase family protein
MLNEQEIMDMALFVYERQIEQIVDGLKQVHERMKQHVKRSIPVVVAGLGRNFLARRAAEKVGFDKIMDLGELLGVNAAFTSPCVGIALLTASKLEEKT